MINVYIDPSSYQYLSNKLFFKEDRDNCLLPWHYLKKYCSERNINLNTIDFWDKNKATKENIYVSFDHKNLVKKIYWRFRKNRNYPVVKFNRFQKKILIQFEPPLIMPEVYKNIDNLLKIYDKTFFSSKLDKSHSHHLVIPRTHSGILSKYWKNSNRKFLTMIHSNKRPQLYQYFWGIFHRYLFEPLRERIKAIDFFSKTNEIDLYGFGWNKYPLFPYWPYKKAIKKVYKGSVKSKYLTLSKYNFAICIESYLARGFIGHAIIDCFFVGTVPVYLGAPDIQDYVPKDCFIDMRDFKNYTDLRSFLKSLTKSEIEAHRQNARKFLESEKFKPFTKEYFAKLFVEAINS